MTFGGAKKLYKVVKKGKVNTVHPNNVEVRKSYKTEKS